MPETDDTSPLRWVRRDVSSVPPLGGYVAKRCPVRAQWDVLSPADRQSPSDLDVRLMAEGVDFEATVFERLVDLHPDAVVIERAGPDDRRSREDLTVSAMRAGAPLILGGRLPADQKARRVGEPDVLLAAHDGGYLPVDVKHHRTLEARSRVAARITDLNTLSPLEAVDPPDGGLASKNKNDLFQLAHYRRMLQACGLAASGGLGAIIGKELKLTWYDLDEPIWTTPSRSEGSKLRSTMDVYDFEFAFRLDVIEVARRHAADPSVELLVVPVRTSECSSCPWWGHCRQLLLSADDVSLLPFASWRMWAAHRDRGVHTITDLASLDWRTAALLDSGIDLHDLFQRLEGNLDDTPIEDVVGRRRWARARTLAEAGITTASDARTLDPALAAYEELRPTRGGAASRYRPVLKNLAASIDMARARIADSPAFRARGIEHITVPRGDIEIDLDLENGYSGGIYLWGALVTDRSGTAAVEQGYRSFVSWDPDPDTTEAAVFKDLCTWLRDLLETLRAQDLSTTVYCYNEQAEATALRRLAGLQDVDRRWVTFIEDLVDSEAWVDLLPICRSGLVTGESMGLKYVAPLAGFSWEDDDPGGEQSMAWHQLAVRDPDHEVREANRRRILSYNRNDVEATLALREWLDASSGDLPSISDLDPA